MDSIHLKSKKRSLDDLQTSDEKLLEPLRKRVKSDLSISVNTPYSIKPPQTDKVSPKFMFYFFDCFFFLRCVSEFVTHKTKHKNIKQIKQIFLFFFRKNIYA